MSVVEMRGLEMLAKVDCMHKESSDCFLFRG
jgi:hypothetical protein